MWNKIVGLVGPTGSGKSYEAAKIMAAQERAAIYQIVKEDRNFLGAATDIFDGDMKAFCIALGEEQFRYIYRVAEGARRSEGNKLIFPDFPVFVECCFARKDMMMIVDEAHFLCNPRYIPVTFWESIVTGRHMYLDIMYMTQRFSMVHHDLTANTHELRFWRIAEPADLRAVEDRCGREVRDIVANLRATVDNRKMGGDVVPGEMYVWNQNEGGYRGNGNETSTASSGDGSNAEGRNDVRPVQGEGQN